MEDRTRDAAALQRQGEHPPSPSGPERDTARNWTWAFLIMALGLWFVQMSLVGFSKPEHNDMDPVSAAGYNHQQNLTWADHVFWIVVVPFAAAVIGALLAGRAPRTGHRARAAAFAAFLGTAATAGFGLYQGLQNIRFVF